MSLVMTSAPALEPVSLAEAKAHLRVDGAADDVLLSSLIETSRLQVEAILGLALIAQSWTWRFDAWPLRAVELPMRPVLSIDLVRVQRADLSYATVPASDYLLDGRGVPAKLHPGRSGLPQPGISPLGIEVQFTAGFGTVAADVPAPLRHAILLLVAHWYEHREPIVAGTPATSFPDAVIALLEPYRTRRL